MYHILCFGDSNTYGYNGETQGRFGWDKRWTGILARSLGSEWLITEEGLNGRTSGFQEHGKKYRDPIPYLAPCILSHMPLDLIIVMLGTNDTKPVFQASPEEIARSMGKLTLRVRNYSRLKGEGCQTLLVAPVPMDDRAVHSGIEFDRSSVKKSPCLASLYQSLAQDLNIHFLDAGTAGIPLCSDGCHFSEEGHRKFAAFIKEKILQILLSPA